MRVKKIFVEILVIWVLCSLTNFVFAEENFEFEVESKPVTVTYNGEQIAFSHALPEIIDGRTMVPLRAIFERMGCEVAFEDGVVTATRNNQEIKLKIGDLNAYIRDGDVEEQCELDVAPVIVNDSTLVPVRFIAQAFGCKTNWNPNMREVVIIDVNAWQEALAAQAPLADALLSMPLKELTSHVLTESGQISGTFQIPAEQNKQQTLEVRFTAQIAGISQGTGKERRSEYELRFDFSEFELYAQNTKDQAVKEILEKLLKLENVTVKTALDADLNLYLAGDGITQIFEIFQMDEAAEMLKDKALLIPVGTMFSDLSGLPVETILSADNIWDGIKTAVEEDDNMFTQTVSNFNDTWNFLIHLFGGEMIKEEGEDPNSSVYQFQSNPTAWKEYLAAPSQGYLSELLSGKESKESEPDENIFSAHWLPDWEMNTVLSGSAISEIALKASFEQETQTGESFYEPTGNEILLEWNIECHDNAEDASKESIEFPAEFVNWGDLPQQESGIQIAEIFPIF